MKILAIESSCDETAAAVVEGVLWDGTLTDGAALRDGVGAENGEVRVLSNVVVSQVDVFAEYGGVIPEVAARSHLEAILPVVHRAMQEAGSGAGGGRGDASGGDGGVVGAGSAGGLTKEDIDCIAVTHTPGLLGSLLIGTLTARTLAVLWKKPLLAVHHLKSHIYSNWLGEGKRPRFPLLALVVSGGHTQIIEMAGQNVFEIIGTTRDDAVGECFDKVAKILGLPYPGGPAIAECAKRGDERRYSLPRPQVEGLDFSFSGLKTAVLRAVQKECGLPITTPSFELKEHLTEQQRADFASCFQRVAAEILVEKMRMALRMHPEVRSVVLAGGVSANQKLRGMMAEAVEEMREERKADGGRAAAAAEEERKASGGRTAAAGEASLEFYEPEAKYAGDNAAMVGAAAVYSLWAGAKPVDGYDLEIAPRREIA